MVQSKPSPASGSRSLYREIRSVLEAARSSVYRTVNTAMVHAYWQVGRLIVEFEQGGKNRAVYGDALLVELSKRLTSEFGRGFDPSNLRYMRIFYQKFPKGGPTRTVGPGRENRDSVRHKFSLRPELSWTHYRLLSGVENSAAREWYMNEAADQHWSTRQLDRQVSVLYYERLISSRRKGPVRREALMKMNGIEPEQFIRDPYVLEFLDLKDYPGLRESTLEQGIIDNLQSFLLELGKGFSFVARQKRIRFEEEDFYVDLVFYNYLLRCFVLVDLKVGKLTHQDIGQMDSYVRLFDVHARSGGDNPTIGLILCSRKNEAIARYSVLSENRQIFAAKYLKYLPSEKQLEREIERGRRHLEMRGAGGRPARG
ncbi:MAG TPA: PDDEXK nuclease domain-containing protein [Bacteroidota bacterium]|nr:PDDEXK nuclease domain-containing protein [Bacteroidota bacterium]